MKNIGIFIIFVLALLTVSIIVPAIINLVSDQCLSIGRVRFYEELMDLTF